MTTDDCMLVLSEIRSQIESDISQILALRDTRISKADGSYVTKGDLLVQDIYAQVLKEHCLDSTIMVSEENSCRIDASTGDQVVFVVDPIDGTENFTSGLPEWGTSASCYKNGQHLASMIGCPEYGTWYFTGSVPEKTFSSRIHGLSSSLSKDEINKAADGYEYRVIGCCVYNLINVIRGSFASFENPKGANSWDILGGLNLALEKGLLVSVNEVKYAGEYLSPNRKYRFKIEHA